MVRLRNENPTEKTLHEKPMVKFWTKKMYLKKYSHLCEDRVTKITDISQDKISDEILKYDGILTYHKIKYLTYHKIKHHKVVRDRPSEPGPRIEGRDILPCHFYRWNILIKPTFYFILFHEPCFIYTSYL